MSMRLAPETVVPDPARTAALRSVDPRNARFQQIMTYPRGEAQPLGRLYGGRDDRPRGRPLLVERGRTHLATRLWQNTESAL